MAATIRRVVGRAEHPSDLMIVARRRLLPHLGSGGGRGGRLHVSADACDPVPLSSCRQWGLLARRASDRKQKVHLVRMTQGPLRENRRENQTVANHGKWRRIMVTAG